MALEFMEDLPGQVTLYTFTGSQPRVRFSAAAVKREMVLRARDVLLKRKIVRYRCRKTGTFFRVIEGLYRTLILPVPEIDMGSTLLDVITFDLKTGDGSQVVSPEYEIAVLKRGENGSTEEEQAPF